MGKTPENKSSGKKAPFGTTKGAFGKEGKGVKGRGGRPLGKMVSTAAQPPLFPLNSTSVCLPRTSPLPILTGVRTG